MPPTEAPKKADPLRSGDGKAETATAATTSETVAEAAEATVPEASAPPPKADTATAAGGEGGNDQPPPPPPPAEPEQAPALPVEQLHIAITAPDPRSLIEAQRLAVRKPRTHARTESPAASATLLLLFHQQRRISCLLSTQT